MPTETYEIARSAAAIQLKNYLKKSYKEIPTPNKDYIRTGILRGLQDGSSLIRSYTGIVITEMVRQGGLLDWPSLLSDLFTIIENQAGSYPEKTQEGAMIALVKICEDNKKALDRDYGGERPIEMVVPKLLSFTMSPIAKVRSNALAALNVFLPEKTPAAINQLPNLLQRIFSLAHDESEEVRKQVCRSILHIAEISPENIVPHLDGLVNYTLAQQKSQEDPELSLDAAEFWVAMGDDPRLIEHLRPFLPAVVPVLLESMIYTEDEILALAGDEDDADEDDKVEDIKPVFATGKDAHGAAALLAANGATADAEANGSSKADDMSEGEVSDDESELSISPEEEWTLRKCSASALDTYATHFGEPVFQVCLPYLMANLTAKEWPQREAAVLALGAIAEGCMEAVKPHLPELTPYLLSLLQDPEPVVRQITCWTLGRYTSWAAWLDPPGRQQFFEPTVLGLLQCMLDRNKKVQESAASAFANLEDTAKGQLIPYCGDILRQFVICFQKYKDRNMFILYDCVQTLAEYMGPELQRPELVNLLMPAIIGRWNFVSDQSREMFPLLECLSYIAASLQEAFQPYAEPIWGRCMRIMAHTLEESIMAAQSPDMYEAPEPDFLITSLDLVSSMVQVLDRAETLKLVSSTQPSIFELLEYSLKDQNNDTRQSAYALLGDFAVHIFDQLQPYLPAMIETTLDQLDMGRIEYDGEETNFAVVNNACWSIGEVSMRAKQSMLPYAERILQKLYLILVDQKGMPESLQENAAIALGRLGYGCAETLAPHLPQLAPLFLQAIGRVDWMHEKTDAILGFVRVVLVNPAAMMGDPLRALFVEFARAPRRFWRGEMDAGDVADDEKEDGELVSTGTGAASVVAGGATGSEAAGAPGSANLGWEERTAAFKQVRF
jgi:transportin-1